MTAISTSVVSVNSSQPRESSLTAAPQVTEPAQIAEEWIPRKAVDEFTLGLNAVVIEILSAHGATFQNSLLNRKLKAYADRSNVANRSTLRLV